LNLSSIDKRDRKLNSSALSALQEFYTERDTRAKAFEDLRTKAEDDFDSGQQQKLSMELFTEDWNASQFWYTDETATVLAGQLLEGATSETRIAVVSAPSVYIQLRNLLVSATKLAAWCGPHDHEGDVTRSTWLIYQG